MTDLPDIIPAKSAIRSGKIAARRAVAPADARAAAEAAARHALTALGDVKGKVVALYMPIRGELDTAPLAQALRAAGAELALPRTHSDNVPMSFREWRMGDELVPGFGRIPEPSEDAEELLPDIVIVPLAAFDARGYRVGYGAGHFDRTFGPPEDTRRPRLVGYAYALQQVEEVPHEPHDVPMDAVVTENGVIRCNPAHNRV